MRFSICKLCSSSKAKAEAWLDSVASSYASANGVTLGSGGGAAGGPAMMMMGGAVVCFRKD